MGAGATIPAMTDRSTTPAGRDMDMVLSLLLTAATGLLERDGGFHPFAARLLEGDAEPAILPPRAAEAFPPADAVLAGLVEAMRMDAGAGGLRCAGLCVDVVAELPEGPGDAVRINVEHVAAPPFTAYLPYRLTGGVPSLADMVMTPGETTVLGPL